MYKILIKISALGLVFMTKECGFFISIKFSCFQVQRVTEEQLNNGSGIEFNLTNIRSNSQIVVEIPFQTVESIRQSRRNKQTTDANNTAADLPVFYCTLIGQQFAFNASLNTSQVKNINKFKYLQKTVETILTKKS